MTTPAHRCGSWLAIGGAIGQLETFRLTQAGQKCRVRLVDQAGTFAGYAEELAPHFRPVDPPAFIASSVNPARS